MYEELEDTFAKNHNTVKAEQGPAHRFLDDFIGTWKLHGHNRTMADEVEGTESYEWFEGEYFLVNRWDRPSTNGPFSGIGWIGFDGESGEYFSCSISNVGFFRLYEVSISAGSLIYTGEKERGMVALSGDRNLIEIRWEQRVGERWRRLCEILGQKIH